LSLASLLPCALLLFFFPALSTPHLSSLSLHDALPISIVLPVPGGPAKRRLSPFVFFITFFRPQRRYMRPLCRSSVKASSKPSRVDRKSTRLNSSHGSISYAVFCLKKKTKQNLATIASK